MGLKKKMKAFFTLKRRANDGFTLVELIVVIAIMAILAGVGTVGYSGYIKASNKGADKTLVGNVIRAVETGTYSTMFASDNSFKKGMTTYPVGVIVLSAENGCEVAASSSTTEVDESTCEVAELNFVTDYNVQRFTNPSDSTWDKILAVIGITPAAFYDQYTINDVETLRYCKTHSNIPPQKTVDTKVEYKTAYKYIWPLGDVPVGQYYLSTATGAYHFLDDCTGMYALATDHVYGDKITTENLVQNEPVRVSVDNPSPIKDALKAAFGEDLSALTLKYDGWGTSEDGGHTYGTLMTYTGTIVADIEGLYDKLDGVKDLAAKVADLSALLAKDYNNSAEMLDTFANTMQTNYADEAALRAEWIKAADQPVNYNMGMNATMDMVYGVRMGYNNGFASYCQANNANPQYLDVIRDYKNASSVTNLIDIPVLVNRAAFNGDPNADQSLYKAFAAVGGDNDATKAAFNEYKELYEEYLQSEAYLKNSDAFYQTLGSVAATGKEAYKDKDPEKYFDYYDNMLEEAAAYYDLINSYNGNGILILVTVEKGIVKCEVSPSSANPRND